MQKPNLLRSIGAIVLGFVAVVVLSLGTDEVLHILNIGLVFGTAVAVATIPMHLGPAWYPISIAATALPCAWIGGALYRGDQISS